MQPSDACLIEDELPPRPLELPRPALNLALRVLQLMAGMQHVTLQIVRIDNTWYLIAPGGSMERLG